MSRIISACLAVYRSCSILISPASPSRARLSCDLGSRVTSRLHANPERREDHGDAQIHPGLLIGPVENVGMVAINVLPPN